MLEEPTWRCVVAVKGIKGVGGYGDWKRQVF